MSLGKIKIIIFIILASFFVPIEISAQRYSFETMEEFYELQSLLVWANKTLSGDIGECQSFNIRSYSNIWNLIKFIKIKII